MRTSNLRLALLLAVSLTGFARGAAADDIADQIGEASKAYERRDMAATASALDAAGRLLRQAIAERWKAMLPAPLSGWNATDGDTATLATAILGGGIQVSKTYQKGDASVEISLIVDSPVMQTVGGLLSGGLFGSDDAKLVVIDGRKATYTRSDNSYTVSAGKAVVTVKGESADDATLRSYLKAINFTEIEKASSK